VTVEMVPERSKRGHFHEDGDKEVFCFEPATQMNAMPCLFTRFQEVSYYQAMRISRIEV
jgi:hypothetical protein